MEVFSVWVYPVLVGLVVSIVSGVVAGVLVGRKVNSSRASTLFKWSDGFLFAYAIADAKAKEADNNLSVFNEDIREAVAQFMDQPTLENSTLVTTRALAGMALVVESTYRWSQKNLLLISLAGLYAHAAAYDSGIVEKLYHQDQDITFAQAYAGLIAELTIVADESSESPAQS